MLATFDMRSRVATPSIHDTLICRPGHRILQAVGVLAALCGIDFPINHQISDGSLVVKERWW
jgi:hypothetical protein